MSRYFMAGNVWLAFAVFASVGRTVEQSEFVKYSFFGTGRWFSPSEYSMFLGTLLAAAMACFALHWRSVCRRS
jgi:hypothetical protein